MADKKEQSSSSSSSSSKSLDSIFGYDEAYVDLLREQAPWKKDRKFFNKCKISALAAMKMLKHALAGVEKGKKRGTNPIEVMGLLIGKPDGNTIIVTDVTPLPVEGTETKVIADDANLYMIKLADSMELRRKENFIGWYHSHPFDVETYSHCHLSATDVQTQYGWQAQLPFWAAIVVDPLRSLARQEPEFGCFRCYPADYDPPKNECPDGTINPDDKWRVQRWGMTYQRYYALETSYFLSTLGNSLLSVMSRNSLWVRVLSSSSVMETENRARFADRVKNVAGKLDTAAHHLPHAMRYGPSGGPSKGSQELEQATQATSDLALEQVKGHISQISKNYLFNNSVQKSSSSSSSSSAPSSSSAMEEKED